MSVQNSSKSQEEQKKSRDIEQKNAQGTVAQQAQQQQPNSQSLQQSQIQQQRPLPQQQQSQTPGSQQTPGGQTPGGVVTKQALKTQYDLNMKQIDKLKKLIVQECLHTLESQQYSKQKFLQIVDEANTIDVTLEELITEFLDAEDDENAGTLLEEQEFLQIFQEDYKKLCNGSLTWATFRVKYGGKAVSLQQQQQEKQEKESLQKLKDHNDHEQQKNAQIQREQEQKQEQQEKHEKERLQKLRDHNEQEKQKQAQHQLEQEQKLQQQEQKEKERLQKLKDHNDQEKQIQNQREAQQRLLEKEKQQQMIQSQAVKPVHLSQSFGANNPLNSQQNVDQALKEKDEFNSYKTSTDTKMLQYQQEIQNHKQQLIVKQNLLDQQIKQNEIKSKEIDFEKQKTQQIQNSLISNPKGEQQNITNNNSHNDFLNLQHKNAILSGEVDQLKQSLELYKAQYDQEYEIVQGMHGEMDKMQKKLQLVQSQRNAMVNSSPSNNKSELFRLHEVEDEIIDHKATNQKLQQQLSDHQDIIRVSKQYSDNLEKQHLSTMQDHRAQVLELKNHHNKLSTQLSESDKAKQDLHDQLNKAEIKQNQIDQENQNLKLVKQNNQEEINSLNAQIAKYSDDNKQSASKGNFDEFNKMFQTSQQKWIKDHGELLQKHSEISMDQIDQIKKLSDENANQKAIILRVQQERDDLERNPNNIHHQQQQFSYLPQMQEYQINEDYMGENSRSGLSGMSGLPQKIHTDTYTLHGDLPMSQRVQVLRYPIPNYKQFPQSMQFMANDQPQPSPKFEQRINQEHLRALISPFIRPLDYYMNKLKRPHKGTMIESKMKLLQQTSDITPQQLIMLKKRCLGTQGFLLDKKDELEVGVITECQTYQGRLYFKCALYVQNLSDKIIKNLQITYPNLDKYTQFWTNPSQVKQVSLSAREQYRQEIFIDTNIPQPQLIQCLILHGNVMETLLLPNLITQYLMFEPTNLDSYKKKWKQRTHLLYRSESIKIDVNLIGQAMDFQSILPNLIQINPHKLQDCELGIDEFKLGGIVTHPNYKTNFLLKFEISPDSSLIIFIAPQSTKHQAIASEIVNAFKFIFQQQ